MKAMKKQIQTKSYLSQFIGISIICLNIYWTYYHLNLFYLYHFTSLLFVVMVPDVILLFNGILGMCGVFIGIAVFRGYLSAVRWLLIDLAILFFGFILVFLSII
ncbi:hypothetical protein CRP01_40745 [Flavilitoribacter nigricans DSM 23189 = NBRC 102662]|uniref:Uncharacterized protein n=1 Tax=Flavilitoribacter nigricans (strain ATCC 23147 / DSM 23189 / NBRC 102662 / NCIMB 1420 / SS-2) TaxID=1122177 RepID=A0A2D0MWU8_FLAN2|nr:hypothetical protein CRP01_40745 [Flavilitoribacter nigricans DSM 23189 = NBRC 102662]